MPRPSGRVLGDLKPSERERAVAEIQAEAQAAAWHRLGGKAKSQLYRRWEHQHGLSHAAVKDGIMKGFDAAHHISPSGEAAVHRELLRHLESSPIPYVRSKVRRPEWRREVDLVLGLSERFLTHIAELEPAPSWQTGLQQALLYKSLYYQGTGIQVLPTMILFGDVSAMRWGQIATVCADQRVLLLSFDLLIDGEEPPHNIVDLLR